MLIDITYFFGNILIAQKSSDAGNINWFIQEYEPKVLLALLGYDTHKLLLAHIAGPAVARFTDLVDGKEYTDMNGIVRKWRGLKFTENTNKISLIAYYVYCKYAANESSSTTGTGEKVADAQNSSSTSARKKISDAWNKMVEMNCELYHFLLSNQATYPEFMTHYGRHNRRFFKRTNYLGI